MTEKSYGTTRYTTAGCDAGNDVRDARGSSTRVTKQLHRKTTDVSTSGRRDRWSPSPRPREEKKSSFFHLGDQNFQPIRRSFTADEKFINSCAPDEIVAGSAHNPNN
jgi:hypothetical protein